MRWGAAALMGGFLSASTGCYFFQSAKAPMPVVTRTAYGPGEAHGLAILLPGFGDGPDDFARQGVVGRLEKRRFDVVCPNAHFGYYRSKTVVRRLQEDVLALARAKGYRRPWLLGVSMGGMGWLAVASRTPPETERYAGLVLVAPYLGHAKVIEEIRRSGDLGSWEPGPVPAEPKDEEALTRTFWHWLKHNRAAGWPVPVFLAFGAEDDMNGAHRLLASQMPAQRVFIRPGGHKWTVWTKLVDDMLARGVFAQPEATSITAANPAISPSRQPYVDVR